MSFSYQKTTIATSTVPLSYAAEHLALINLNNLIAEYGAPQTRLSGGRTLDTDVQPRTNTAGLLRARLGDVRFRHGPPQWPCLSATFGKSVVTLASSPAG